MNGVSLDDVAAVTLTSGPKKPNKKMVIMKRNSSTNTSGSGDGLANGKREGRSRRKNLEKKKRRKLRETLMEREIRLPFRKIQLR
jgi:hypothetical protein